MKLFSNCLLFEVYRAVKDGQYIVIRKTRRKYKWPFCKYHFLVLPKEIVDEYAVSYTPVKKDLGDWPCPIFKGFVKRGD